MKSKNKKVWFVSELFYPEETSTGYFLTKITGGIASLYNVNAICSQPTYSSRGYRFAKNQVHNGVNIHRCFSTTFNKDIVALRILNTLTFTISVFFNSFFRYKKGDIVFVVTNPPLIPFAIAIAGIFKNTKICIIVHDVYPEVLVATGLFRLSSPFVNMIGRTTNWLYKKMDRILVLGRDMAELISKKLNNTKENIQIIPNWADVNFIHPRERKSHPFLKENGIEKKFVVQYSGNIGRTHGIELLLTCAEKLRKISPIHFLFIGFGGKKKWLEREVKKKALSNVTCLNYRPRNELPLSLTACDVSAISFVKGMTGISVPSRMYNIMAAGKPIIAVAEPESELALVVNEENIGWTVIPGDVEGLKNAILDAQSHPEKVAEMGSRARRVAETKYSYEQAIQKYHALIEDLISEEKVS